MAPFFADRDRFLTHISVSVLHELLMYMRSFLFGLLSLYSFLQNDHQKLFPIQMNARASFDEIKRWLMAVRQFERFVSDYLLLITPYLANYNSFSLAIFLPHSLERVGAVLFRF